MQDWKANQAAKAVAAKALQVANPHLIPVGEKVDQLNAAAKNTRTELKRAFPGVKFSVKTSRFSMGNDMRVTWTDGPNVYQVEQITEQYSAGTFDGMTDCYNYERGAWTDAFGQAKYVLTDRHYSDAAIESAIRYVKQEYAGNLKDREITEITAAQFNAGKLYDVAVMENSDSGYWGLQSIIRRTLDKKTWCLNMTPKAMEMVEADEVAA